MTSQLEALAKEIGFGGDAAQLSLVVDYEYDSAYRLIEASNSQSFGSLSYRYDRVGNLLNKSAFDLSGIPTEQNLGSLSYQKLLRKLLRHI